MAGLNLTPIVFSADTILVTFISLAINAADNPIPE
jgi:hypothetical protein